MNLTSPVQIGSITIRNRLYRAPVLEGAASSKDPAGTYVKHFEPNAKAGVGLIVQGNTVVLPEGRTAPGMTAVNGPAVMADLRRVTDAVHQHGASIVVQLGHGGMFALEAWHKVHKQARTGLPLAPSLPPWWLRALHSGVHVLSVDEIRALVERFGIVAAWAKDAGYDGVQLAASNAKLLHQFLSRTFNHRTDAYGGSVENRARILVEIRDSIARHAGTDYPVLLKYCASEIRPVGTGIALDEGIRIAQIAEQGGFAAVTPAATSNLPDTALCKGDYPAGSFEGPLRERLREAAGGEIGLLGLQLSMRAAAYRFPFKPVWNRTVFASVKREIGIPVFAVGGIRTPQEANEILAEGLADVIGVGRPFYAEPELPRWFLANEPRTTTCSNCNRCVVPQMLGMPGACYNPGVRRKAA